MTRNRILGVALGIAVACAVLALQSRQPAAFDLLPENEGSIATLALQYTHDSAHSTELCYRAFLKAIGPRTEIIAVCGDKSEADEFRQAVKRWGVARPERARTVVVGAPITGWCKDRFLVSAGRPNLLIHPPRKETGLESRNHDYLVAPALARAYSGRFMSREIPLDFDSGDILATRGHVVVSDVLWRKNGSQAGFRDRLERTLGRKVIWLKGVPKHHIGMFAAPLDEQTMAVGDPELARPLWNSRLDAGFGSADFSEKAVLPFKRAADQLRAAGFRVVRVPTVVLAPQVYLTYTNGVFETRGRSRIVYMPSYGEPRLDAMARRAYEKAGWQVRPIPVERLYRFRGTIGCLVNVLERG